MHLSSWLDWKRLYNTYVYDLLHTQQCKSTHVNGNAGVAGIDHSKKDGGIRILLEYIAIGNRLNKQINKF